MLHLEKDKTTGLVESVGPGTIRADGKATITPSENPELINPVSKRELRKSTVWDCSTFLESIHWSAVGCDSLTAVHIFS